ncbi:glycosyltransferase family 2 protein [Nocardioides sp. GY 10113]|uniref:glycosyltransferase family 2 protein n=1 Tax=Nocardioides sp. GY 10113 TaxID=2569761 RepID=UPI0010A7BB86|nr:glycosyltransferase family 2 protein [Nocardioides sp. GY 10113]TIC80653.1 glycosyltransferase family 2 protein [Nocardioides sp. GY 10113]
MARADLILPCRDEAAALERLLPLVPEVLRVVVVDNGSTDGTAEVARRYGATVVHEPEPGYGAAVAAGLDAAEADIVAFMDGDGSFDPTEVLPLVDAVAAGAVDLAAGRRRPVRRGTWPWHARLGNDLVVRWLRRRTGFPLHDLPAMRACRREALVALGVHDRRFGYPVELMQAAVAAGWRFAEYDVRYLPRAEGTRSKVSGSVRGTVRAARDFYRVLA